MLTLVSEVYTLEILLHFKVILDSNLALRAAVS